MKIKTFAERLDEALILRNMKPADLVAKSKDQLDKSSVSQYLSGKYNAKQDKLSVIARILNVNESWLMGYDVNIKSNTKGVKIPVLGRVVAGIPIEAIEEIIDYEEITREMSSHGEHFGLVVKGDSMLPRFVEGDVVIVRKQSDVESGDIAVILINGSDATIKRISRDSNGITLIPLNNFYMPKFYSNDDIEKLPIIISGKVIELRGKFN